VQKTGIQTPVQDKNYVPPLDAILVIIVTFFLTILISATFIFLLPDVSVVLVVGEVLTAVPPLAYLVYKRVDMKNYFGAYPKPKFILMGLVLGFGLLLLGVLVSGMVILVFGESEAVAKANEQLLELSQTPHGLAAAIATCLLAGICEELAFRGFLQNSIRGKYSAKTAMLISSVAFALFHFDPQGAYIATSFIMGLVLGYIYNKWHSYITNATAHAVYNILALAILLAL